MLQGTWTGVLEGQDPIRYLIAACGDGSSAIAFVRAAVQQEGVIPQILLQRWAIVGREQSCASRARSAGSKRARTTARRRLSGSMDDLQNSIVQNGMQRLFGCGELGFIDIVITWDQATLAQ